MASARLCSASCTERAIGNGAESPGPTGIQQLDDRRARDQRPLHPGAAAILVESCTAARYRHGEVAHVAHVDYHGIVPTMKRRMYLPTQSTLTASISPRMVTTVARCRQCARISAPPQSKVPLPCRVATLVICSPIHPWRSWRSTQRRLDLPLTSSQNVRRLKAASNFLLRSPSPRRGGPAVRLQWLPVASRGAFEWLSVMAR